VIGMKAGSKSIESDETAHQQRRAHHQDHRHGDLGDHERVPQQTSASSTDQASANVLERMTEIGLRGADSGHEPKDDGRDKRYTDRKEHHGRIDADGFGLQQVLPVGIAVGAKGPNVIDDAVGEGQSRRAAGDREHRAFGE